MSSNLPPGVTTSMLPGNTPQDSRYEKLLEDFFRAMLGDVDEPTAPFGLLDVQGDGSAVEEARLALDAPLSRELRRQAQRHGVSAASLFHLAWALVLGRTTGKDDVVFGTVLFGRMQGGEGAHSALGMFINTLPLRIRLGGRSVQDCLHETHAGLTGLMHHEHATLSLAQRCSVSSRRRLSMSRSCSSSWVRRIPSRTRSSRSSLNCISLQFNCNPRR